MEYILCYYNKNNESFIIIDKSRDYKYIFDRVNECYEIHPNGNFTIFSILSDRGSVC